MSEIVKLNLKQNNHGVKVKETLSQEIEIERNEDFFQNQMQRQYETGYNKGYETAIAELEKTYDDKIFNRLKDLHNLAAALEQNIKDHEEYYESVLIQLSLILAEKIIKREVTDKTIIDDVLKESLKKIIGANSVIVKLNPSDFTKMSSETKGILNDSTFSKIKFEGDERIEQGGCFIESEIGNVDARLDTQLNELKRNMEVFTTKDKQ